MTITNKKAYNYGFRNHCPTIEKINDIYKKLGIEDKIIKNTAINNFDILPNIIIEDNMPNMESIEGIPDLEFIEEFEFEEIDDL